MRRSRWYGPIPLKAGPAICHLCDRGRLSDQPGELKGPQLRHHPLREEPLRLISKRQRHAPAGGGEHAPVADQRGDGDLQPIGGSDGPQGPWRQDRPLYVGRYPLRHQRGRGCHRGQGQVGAEAI